MLIQCKTQEGYDFLTRTYVMLSHAVALPDLRILIDECYGQGRFGFR